MLFRSGLVGVESVLCGTPLIGAEGMGCMEVLTADAALPFRVDQPGSLDATLAQALERWRQGTLGVADPLTALRYDPSVGAHLDRLLAWVARLGPTEP